jgi:hypothetical protein
MAPKLTPFPTSIISERAIWLSRTSSFSFCVSIIRKWAVQRNRDPELGPAITNRLGALLAEEDDLPWPDD